MFVFGECDVVFLCASVCYKRGGVRFLRGTSLSNHRCMLSFLERTFDISRRPLDPEDPPEPPPFPDVSDTVTSKTFPNISGVTICLVNKGPILQTNSAMICRNVSLF